MCILNEVLPWLEFHRPLTISHNTELCLTSEQWPKFKETNSYEGGQLRTHGKMTLRWWVAKVQKER